MTTNNLYDFTLETLEQANQDINACIEEITTSAWNHLQSTWQANDPTPQQCAATVLETYRNCWKRCRLQFHQIIHSAADSICAEMIRHDIHSFTVNLKVWEDEAANFVKISMQLFDNSLTANVSMWQQGVYSLCSSTRDPIHSMDQFSRTVRQNLDSIKQEFVKKLDKKFSKLRHFIKRLLLLVLAETIRGNIREDLDAMVDMKRKSVQAATQNIESRLAAFNRSTQSTGVGVPLEETALFLCADRLKFECCSAANNANKSALHHLAKLPDDVAATSAAVTDIFQDFLKDIDNLFLNVYKAVRSETLKLSRSGYAITWDDLHNEILRIFADVQLSQVFDETRTKVLGVLQILCMNLGTQEISRAFM